MLQKPFGIREFLARVNAQRRRYNASMNYLQEAPASGVPMQTPIQGTQAIDSNDGHIHSSSAAGILEHAGIVLDDVRNASRFRRE